MNDRLFSDHVQYKAVLSNLEQNSGQLKCAVCGKILKSKSECHFDHILAYSKGGKSISDNCQILCADCNLSKSDKDMQDYVLQEKAKKFMAGEIISEDVFSLPKQPLIGNDKMTKEQFDMEVRQFIAKHGNIKKVDFTRDKNKLPSTMYIVKYYGSMKDLKLAFGLETDTAWNRENIWERLVGYAETNPWFKQTDLVKCNGMPSLPCILSYYPEYKNFSDIRIALGLGLNSESWPKDRVVDACKKYLKTHSKITLKDLRKENGLPTSKVIYNYYGSMQRFQEEMGSEISKRQEFISKEEIIAALKDIINQRGSVFVSRAEFLSAFPYSQSAIISRYGSFDTFAKAANITFLKTKKAKYTKQEVDDCILTYLKNGNPIPSSAKLLSERNLPSASTILKYYDDWKEPFVLYLKMIRITSKQE